MALKIRVHWSEEPLEVRASENAIAEITEANGPHVQTLDSDVLVVDFFEEDNRVRDVSRYRILEAGHCECVRHNNRYGVDDRRYIVPHCDIPEDELIPLLQQEETLNVLLLLESPHKDEYQAGNVECPIAPANGATGDSIDRLLSTVLAGIEGDDLVIPHGHVIISNPIQFQTSLHAIHGNGPGSESRWNTLRNNVWKTLWGQPGGHVQQNFQERLAAYNPSLIINACTGGVEQGTLNSLVEACLPNDVPRRRSRHPSHPSKPLVFY